jgi:hypothetical protein
VGAAFELRGWGIEVAAMLSSLSSGGVLCQVALFGWGGREALRVARNTNDADRKRIDPDSHTVVVDRLI